MCLTYSKEIFIPCVLIWYYVIHKYILVTLQIEKLQALLQDSEVCKINFSDFEALPLPLDPDIKVNAINPESASLFKVDFFYISSLLDVFFIWLSKTGPIMWTPMLSRQATCLSGA